MGFIALLILNVLFVPAAAGFLLFFLLSPRRSLLKTLLDELPERCALSAPKTGPGAVWLHAASVGETRSLALLVRRLRAEYPKLPLLISTNTAAGKKAAETLSPDAAVLSPLDFYPFTSAFVKKYRPRALFIAERDLWPNMISAAKAADIPVCIVNGRLSSRSAGRYALACGFMKYVFGKISGACAQTEQDAANYRALGMSPSKITVTGNLKYDLLERQPTKRDEARRVLARLAWTNSPLLVLGSTHPAEEQMLAREFSRLKSAVPEVKIVLAPRHLERTAQINASMQEAEIKTALYSEQDGNPGADCLIVDAMGLLTSFYSFATLCFIGGTIAEKGGHNMLEAAILGKPMIAGPHYYNTPEVAVKLIADGAAFQISEETFADTTIKLLKAGPETQNAGKAALETALSFTGATDKTMPVIREFLA
ncbi:MAG: hypothetical protein GX410_00410 [Elusimicrobia bacterium]|nr:hypothetical protein [Elusimicrobiota bacterium]